MMKQLKKNNEVLILTTRGCEGCEIIKNIVIELINEYKLDISLEVKDRKEVDKRFLRINNITDFPYTIFYNKDDEVIFSFAGVMPKVSLYNKIKNEVLIV